MKRKKLIREIQQLDRALTDQHVLFQLRSRQALDSLHRLHPGWIIGVGLISGMMAGWLGLRTTYIAGLTGLKFQPLIQQGINYLTGTGVDV